MKLPTAELRSQIPRYRYTVSPPYHGESKSLWYVVRWPSDSPEEWEAIASYTNPQAASREVRRLREKPNSTFQLGGAHESA